MAQLLHGDRIGRLGRLSPGCSALVFDTSRGRVLLTRRTDNGRWCLPAGALEAGESAAEGCERELREETGLRGRVTRLIGIYTSPHWSVVRTDGSRIQPVSCSFEVAVIGGELGLSDETTAFGWFTPHEIAAMDVMDHHRERIVDAFAAREAAFVK